MGEATQDTKEALEALRQIADVIGIKEMTATDKVLEIDGRRIGICCNSTYATVMEAIGAIFLDKYVGEFRKHTMSKDTVEAITRYFVRPKIPTSAAEEAEAAQRMEGWK